MISGVRYLVPVHAESAPPAAYASPFAAFSSLTLGTAERYAGIPSGARDGLCLQDVCACHRGSDRGLIGPAGRQSRDPRVVRCVNRHVDCAAERVLANTEMQRFPANSLKC